MWILSKILSEADAGPSTTPWELLLQGLTSCAREDNGHGVFLCVVNGDFSIYRSTPSTKKIDRRGSLFWVAAILESWFSLHSLGQGNRNQRKPFFASQAPIRRNVATPRGPCRAGTLPRSFLDA